jgi:serine protease AprX
MRRMTRRACGLALALLVLLPAAALPAGGAASGKLWVFFTDKNLRRSDAARAIEDFRAALPERALARRAKAGAEVTIADLPVASEYVSAVGATGALVVARSRWLNAVSVRADEDQVAAIAALPFVREIRPVARGTTSLPEFMEAPPPPPSGGDRALDYGPSLCQLEEIDVPELHDAGFDGSGVLICMLDTGFDTDHQCFRNLDIVAERDFINNDAVTENQPGDPDNQDSHGTATLSCVGAAFPGRLYGASYGASFALAKTEIIDQEIQAEEDYWVEAVEWGDSLGADVVSSSLGYLDWYTYADMDGNTAVTTIAADMAAARGIVVVNSMGNEGESEWRYMIAPADGDSVLSVGAVDCGGTRVNWSSVGPTADGRIKPDVMALGLQAYVATTEDTATYAHASGTSFSCPITAGAVGLLLQGHPDWIPSDVIAAVHATASQSGAPDTLMGWGILSATDAMYSSPVGVEEGGLPGEGNLVLARPNPFSPEARIEYIVPVEGRVTVAVYDLRGRLVRTLVDEATPAGTHSVSWDGTNTRGEGVGSGVYFVRLSTPGREGHAKMTLLR